jgi:transposase-like protein
MSRIRKQYSSKFKFQIALEAVRETKTINQLASEHGLHPNLVSLWKRQLLDSGPEIFNHSRSDHQQQLQTRETELFEQIGRLKMELEWLKKKAAPFN